jgi:hypothetical protein
MPTPPDLDASLADVGRRLRLRHALRAQAVGCVAAGTALVFARYAHALDEAAVAIAGSTFLLGAGLTFAALRGTRTSAAAASAFERADPSLQNLIVTAEEIMRPSGNTPDYMRTRVLSDARRRVSTLDLRTVVPLARDALVLLGAVVMLGIAGIARPASVKGDVTKSPSPRIIKSNSDVFAIEVVPPAYTGRPTVRLTNPTSIEAIAGSQAIIRVPAGSSQIRLNGALVPSSRDGVAEVLLTASGYLAIDAGAVHRLLPLSVTPVLPSFIQITGSQPRSRNFLSASGSAHQRRVRRRQAFVSFLMVLVIGLAWALHDTIRPSVGGWLGPMVLGVYGLAYVALAFATCDHGCAAAAPSLSHRIHFLLGDLIVVAAVAAWWKDHERQVRQSPQNAGKDTAGNLRTVNRIK